MPPFYSQDNSGAPRKDFMNKLAPQTADYPPQPALLRFNSIIKSNFIFMKMITKATYERKEKHLLLLINDSEE